MDRISRGLRVVVSLLILASCTRSGLPQNTATKRDRRQDEISALIDKLQQLKEEGMGYVATRSGGAFLPLGTSETGALLLGQKPPADSQVLRDLVKRGADAIPYLIAHLDDQRTCGITVKEPEVFGGMFFDDEYDFNRRTAMQPPTGVNRRSADGQDHPHGHTVTVGDLCFVALGQIVNRSFAAVRYQPTMCIMVSSPTGSARLREAIQREWGTLTREQHKASLIRDFVEPDFEPRRTGACLRLGYYYPEALESLALKQLSQPYFDVFEVERLAREKLYREKKPQGRKTLFDAYIARHGEVARQGLREQLFDDLDLQEADEDHRISPPLAQKYMARACLIELYGYPVGVRSEDRRRRLPTNQCVQARFIDTIALFPTPKIDQAVRNLLHSAQDDYLTEACARYLVGRGADVEIRQYVEQNRKTATGSHLNELLNLRERLGWTPLHVAAELDQTGRLEDLIRNGLNVNARAANGQTPLHVAADHGSFGALRVLLAHKADPNLQDKRGRAPIQLGIQFESAAEMLLAGGADPLDIFSAAFAGRADRVKNLLAKDKSLARARTADGETALHIAARRDHVHVAEVLLDYGADVNAVDNQRNRLTPLHRAATYAGREMVAFLLAHKADPMAKSWDGRDALDHARDNRNEEIVRLLETNR